MNHLIDLLIWIVATTDNGNGYVTGDDIPDALASIYGDATGEDPGALSALQYDVNGLVALGWIAKHVRDGAPIFVLTAAGFVAHQSIEDVSATDETPTGPLG